MRVLVIHGGGVRGVIPAVFLTQIENHFGKIADNFDITEPEMAKIDNAKRDNLLKLKGLAGFLNRTELEKIKHIIEKNEDTI